MRRVVFITVSIAVGSCADNVPTASSGAYPTDAGEDADALEACSGCVLGDGGCNHGDGGCNHDGAFDDAACGNGGSACERCPSTCNAGVCEPVNCTSDANCPSPFACVEGQCATCAGCLLQVRDVWQCVDECPPSYGCNPTSRRCEFIP